MRNERSTDEEGKRIVLVGHGDVKPGTGGEWTADRKKRGATNIVDEVSDAHIIFDFDEPDQATEMEGTSGPGDSGGPAFIDVDGLAYLAGVSSLGEPGKSGPGTYGAREHYVRVSRYLEWIDRVMAKPPVDRLVNVPARREAQVVRRGGSGGSGGIPPGVFLLEEIGLLVRDVGGHVQMVGRIDQRFPKVLLKGSIRPPAVVISLDGNVVESSQGLKARFDALVPGQKFVLEFEMNGLKRVFELTK